MISYNRLFVNGVSYHVKMKEELEAKGHVILLHGFTGTLATWETVVNQLAGFCCITPDLLGHGKTTAPSDPMRYDILKQVADLAEVLRQLKIESIHVVGYSMGGRLAIAFAIHYPEMIKSLILESASPGLLTEDERKLRRQQDAKLAEKIIVNGLASFVSDWENQPLFVSQKKLDQYTKMAIQKERLSHDPLGLKNSLLGMGTGSQPCYAGQLSKLRCPVLIITGENDQKFKAISRKMAEKIVHVQEVVVPKSGHAVHIEQPALYTNFVLEFIQDSLQDL